MPRKYVSVKKIPSVSVIVPLYKEDKETLNNCINSLLNQDYKNYKIYLVLDSKCSKNVRDIANKYSNKKNRNKLNVIKDTKRGSASHRNLGVKHSMNYADYFAFTDADCVAEKDWLSSLVECMRRCEKIDKNIGCVGGINISKNENFIGNGIQCAESSFIGGGGLSAQTTIQRKEKYVSSIPNCNALYKKECWIKEKQDESLIKGQDGEFNLRLSKKGWKFFQTPNAVIYHKRGDLLTWYSKKMFKYGEAAAKIIKKHGFYGIKRYWYSLGIFAFYFFTLILIVVGIFYNVLLKIVLCYLLIYLILILLSSLYELRRKNQKIKNCLLAIPIIILQHISYAFGFFMGLFR